MTRERCSRCGWIMAPGRKNDLGTLCAPCRHAVKHHQDPGSMTAAPEAQAVKQAPRHRATRSGVQVKGFSLNGPFALSADCVDMIVSRGYRVHVAPSRGHWVAMAHHPRLGQSHFARAESRAAVVAIIVDMVDADRAA